jgi:hypothetical protein
MAKPGPRSAESKNVAGNSGSGGQAVSTHPDTRAIQPSRAGAPGYQSVKPTQQPIPSIADAESRRQKGQSPIVPVDLASVGSATTEAEQRHQPSPVPPGVTVPTNRTYDQGEK